MFPERWHIRLLLLAQLGCLSFGIRVPVVKADGMNLSVSLDDALHDLKYTLIGSHQNGEEIEFSNWGITQSKFDSDPTIRW